MPAIRTKPPAMSIYASPHPQANREAKEEYLLYEYPKLTLHEDFSSGVARRTKWFAILKDKDKTTIYFERGSQQYSTLLEVQHPEFKGEWFSSGFNAAKALSDYLEKGSR